MIDQLAGSGIVVVAGIAGVTLISWILPKKRILEAINAPPKRFGPIVLSAKWIILIGRCLPVAAAVLLLITCLV